ncbi:MAG: hypothetical protein ACQEQ4_07580 [Fibrobacterota bacterium]
MKFIIIFISSLLFAACYTQVSYVGRGQSPHDYRQYREQDTTYETDEDDVYYFVDSQGDTVEYTVLKRQDTPPRDTVIIREEDREVWIWVQDHWGRWELRRFDHRSPYWRDFAVSYRFGYPGGFYSSGWYDPRWRYPRRDTIVIIDKKDDDDDDDQKTDDPRYDRRAGGRSREPSSVSSGSSSERTKDSSQGGNEDTTRREPPRTIQRGRSR